MEKKIENSHFAKSKVYTNESEEKQLEDLIDLWRKKTFSIKDLPDIVHAINSNDIFQQNYGVIALRKILSTSKDIALFLCFY